MAARFLKGDRVRFTAALLRMLDKDHSPFGTVTSDQRLIEHVNVRPDSCKSSSRFHVHFVQRIREE